MPFDQLEAPRDPFRHDLVHRHLVVSRNALHALGGVLVFLGAVFDEGYVASGGA